MRRKSFLIHSNVLLRKTLSLLLKTYKKKAEGEDAPEVLDREEEIKKTIKLLTPLMLATIKIEGDIAFDGLGLAQELPLSAAASKLFVKNHVKRVSTEMTDSTIDKTKKRVICWFSRRRSYPRSY